MTTVISPDGTCIGYESVGAGPPLLLVHGSTGARARWSSVTAVLAQRYTVHAMDRRGRGLSIIEVEPYSLSREAEDVAAVAGAVGGDVYVVGHSYGALAVLEAALITSAFRRIMLYEPPIPSRGHDVGSPEGLARITTMSDPREILDAFYRETLYLPQPAIKRPCRSRVSVSGRLDRAHRRPRTRGGPRLPRHRAASRDQRPGASVVRHPESRVSPGGRRGRSRLGTGRDGCPVARPRAPGGRLRPTTIRAGGAGFRLAPG
ncbi:alpha/beta hydrolase [Mycobacterium colombiense]|uniref:alpha/beta hydrolase n=1 Tax=Mycobacterium colombiense TaxID=339268 RepID=UPI000A9C8075|nr:alpha/beta hydrolase [Mycobacterium colombiense]